MSKSALILLAEGAEEMETVITADILTRAGVSVTIAGVNGADVVKCSRDVRIQPHKSLPDATSGDLQYDVIVLPGGGDGAKRLSESQQVGSLLRDQEVSGRLIAAICAAPTALAAHGIAKGKRVTSYPAMKGAMTGYAYIEDRVVTDGNLVTSRGPGTAVEFAFKLVELLVDKETVAKLSQQMLVQ